MRTILLASGLTLLCGCESRSRHSAESGKKPEDLQKFVEKLKSNTPTRFSEFKAKQLKAKEYELSVNPEYFLSVTVEFDPVYLHDSITGKSNWYGGAILVSTISNVGSEQRWSSCRLIERP